MTACARCDRGLTYAEDNRTAGPGLVFDDGSTLAVYTYADWRAQTDAIRRELDDRATVVAPGNWCNGTVHVAQTGTITTEGE